VLPVPVEVLIKVTLQGASQPLFNILKSACAGIRPQFFKLQEMKKQASSVNIKRYFMAFV
jgi:hypothetical protein